MTIAEACEAYLRDLEARGIAASTRENYKYLFRQLQVFARDATVDSLGGIDKESVRRWREGSNCADSTHGKRLKGLKAFFAFAEREGWVLESPVTGVRAPKPTSRPTMPLSVNEMAALLSAAADRPRERALLLLLRYSGLSIVDAATLRHDAVTASGDLVLRRAKSGELVIVALPPEVTLSLESITRPGRKHYFWTGSSKPVSTTKYWRGRLSLVAAAAGVDGFHPHRLRDTFAVELLLAGVMIQDVSSLLGHGSVATTERYYAPWNLARRERLKRIVRDVHQQDPILLAFTPKKPAGTVGAAPAEASLATSPVPKPTRRAYG